MDVKKFLIDYLKGGKKLERMNFEAVDVKNTYKKILGFMNKHTDIEGVNQEIAVIKSVYTSYEKSMQQLINQEKGNEEKKYKLWKISYLIKNIGKITAGVFGIVSIIYLILNFNMSNWGFLLWLVMILIWVLGILGSVISKIIEVIAEKIYVSYVKRIEDMIYEIVSPCIDDMECLYDRVDKMYLNTLEPTLKMQILLRRDQQRQHEEQLEMQREYNEKLLEMQYAQNEELYKTRKAQERLLEIEEVREGIRKRYR